MKRLWIALSLVLIIVLSGCGSNESSDSKGMLEQNKSDMAMEAPSMEEAESVEYAKEASDFNTVDLADGESSKYEDGGSTGTTQVAYERKIIKTGFVYMETLEFDKTLEDMKTLINKYNAYTSYSESNAGSIFERGYNSRYSSYTIKVPAEMFEEMYEELHTMGNVLNSKEGKQDVTSQFIDIEARLTTLKVQEERLLSILAKTENLEDVIELEYALQDTRYEIEKFTTNLRNLEDQVRFSTIEVNVQEVYEETIVDKPVITFGDKISTGLSETFKEISQGFQNLIIFLVTQFPYLIFTAIVLFILAKIFKRMSKKSSIEKAKKNEDVKSVVDPQDDEEKH